VCWRNSGRWDGERRPALAVAGERSGDYPRS
jgi:hypothetical protein